MVTDLIDLALSAFIAFVVFPLLAAIVVVGIGKIVSLFRSKL